MRIARRARSHFDARAAVRRARRLAERPARVRVCWDLDNTLVDSGSLLCRGVPLGRAVVDAEPMPNMLPFYEAVRTRLDGAEHIVVTARGRALRPATLAWMQRHRLADPEEAVLFVPDAPAKARVWTTLARGAALVIVDDLRYGHETEHPAVYGDLAEAARRTAVVYLGADVIGEIGSGAASVAAVAERVAGALQDGA